MDTTKKILVIDDEPDLAQMVGFQFKSRGFEVQTAGDGAEALAKVHEFKPDLIILDMNMPRMGGIEFYSKICGPNGKPMYPVLVLTARANVQGLFKDLEIDGFLVKPFEIDHLVAEGEAIIRKRGQSPKGPGLAARPRKICIVENDPKVFDGLAGILLNADYTVIPAKSGTAAVERMAGETPDAALVQLGLSDIPGDILILKLSQMARTMDVKFILYTARATKHDRQVMERISAKTGVLTLVEYHALKDLLDKVKEL